jgi:hypothetical protein
VVEIARSLRRIRPQRFTRSLHRRSREELPFVANAALFGPDLLLDTCVYIDVLHGRAPPELKALMETRVINHHAICVAELVHAFGRLDPRHPGTKTALLELAPVVAAIPEHRLHVASPAVLIEAGILTGLLSRLGGFRPDQHLAALNDATVFLHAPAGSLF